MLPISNFRVHLMLLYVKEKPCFLGHFDLKKEAETVSLPMSVPWEEDLCQHDSCPSDLGRRVISPVSP